MSRSLLHIITKILLSTLILLNAYTVINAQNGKNPFDLDHRLSKQILSDTTSTDQSNNPFDLSTRQTEPIIAQDTLQETTPTVQQNPSNPFDIERVKIVSEEKEEIAKAPLPQQIIQEKASEDKRSGFLFWVILTIMILLALLFTLYRSLIGKIYRAFINENILKLLQREQNVIISIPYLFLYILFFLSAGIFLFQLGYYYGYLSYKMSHLIYCILGTFTFFTLKHIILKLIEIIFPIAKEVKQYSFTIVIFSIIMGIILIPLNVFIAFAPDSLTYTGIIIAFLTILAVYLFRALRGIFIGSKFLAFHKFHFFMYICIVEIAPCVVLIKLLLNGANIQ